MCSGMILLNFPPCRSQLRPNSVLSGKGGLETDFLEEEAGSSAWPARAWALLPGRWEQVPVLPGLQAGQEWRRVQEQPGPHSVSTAPLSLRVLESELRNQGPLQRFLVSYSSRPQQQGTGPAG